MSGRRMEKTMCCKDSDEVNDTSDAYKEKRMDQMDRLEADVVVCGCGSSGLTAALTASYGGARVIALEKRSAPGGTSLFAEGLFAVESKMQVQNGISASKDDVFRTHMEYSHWRANGRLVKRFMDESASTIEWLQQHGVEFEEVRAIAPGGPRVWHVMKGNPVTRGAGLINSLVGRARQNGVRILLQTAARELLTEENRIRGIIAVDKAGKEVRIDGKAVIIATAGFQNNREMLREYTGMGSAITPYDLDMTGDGIRMAWEVGAAPEGTDVVLGGTGIKGENRTSSLAAIMFQPYLWVNHDGERFCPEDVVYFLNAHIKYTNGTRYTVFDENTKAHLMEKGIDRGMGHARPVGYRPETLDAELERGVAEGKVFMADTLSELAAKTGMSGERLQGTVDEYNRFCDEGHDGVFAKNPSYLQPVRQARFYAVKCGLSLHCTLGGIKINDRMEVLDKKGQIIPGLYAGGNCAGGMYGDTYDIAHTTGGALGFAVNSGRIAGESALHYIGLGEGR
jgi:fumarate reductase flavoprotein subunit